MKIGIASDDHPPSRTYYSKIDGLIKASKQDQQSVNSGITYEHMEPDKTYDIVINWEPYGGGIHTGTLLTIVWAWDTNRAGFREKINNDFDLLFRKNATFYHPIDILPIGKQTFWMPPCVDEEVFQRDQKVVPDYDIVFVGYHRTQRRAIECFPFLDKHFNLLHITKRLSYKKYIKQMSRGRILLNIPDYMETNKRIMEAMSMGPMMQPWGPDYSLLIVPDYHFIEMPYPEEKHSLLVSEGSDTIMGFVEKVRNYLLNPSELNKISKNGRKLIKAKFTFKHQVRRVNKIIDLHLSQERLKDG